MAEHLITAMRWQVGQLRREFNRDATVVILGKAEDKTLAKYLAERFTDRKGIDSLQGGQLFGLEVKIDGDVGIRVG